MHAHSYAQKCIYTLTHAQMCSLARVPVCMYIYVARAHSCVCVRMCVWNVHYEKYNPVSQILWLTVVQLYEYTCTLQHLEEKEASVFFKGAICTQVSRFIALRSQFPMCAIYCTPYLHLMSKTILHVIIFTMKHVLMCLKYVVKNLSYKECI